MTRKLAKAVLILATTALLLELFLRLLGAGASFFTAPRSAAGHGILCIGDSFVWGAGGKGFTEQLQDIFDLKYGAGAVPVLNYGKPGTNSSYLADQFQKLLKQTSPGAVIILTGMNNRWKRVREDGRLASDSSTWPHFSRWRLFKLVQGGESASRLSEERIQKLAAEENGLLKTAESLPPDTRGRLSDLYCASAELYYDLNDFGNAERELDKAIAFGTLSDAASARGILRSCLYCHREDKLSSLLKGLGKNFSDSAEGNFVYAKMYSRLGQQEQSKKCLQKAIELEPKFWVYHCAMGEVLFLKDQASAVRYFRQAMQLAPLNAQPHYGLGFLWFKNHNWRDAEAEFKLALHLDQGFAEALRRLADLYAVKGELARFQSLGHEVPALAESAEYLKIQASIEADSGRVKSTPQSEWVEDVSGAVRAARSLNIPVLVSSYPEFNLEGMREAAEQNGAVYADLEPIFKSRFKSRGEYVGYDELHCNTAGYRLMAEVYADKIGQLFSDKQTGAATAAPASKTKLR